VVCRVRLAISTRLTGVAVMRSAAVQVMCGHAPLRPVLVSALQPVQRRVDAAHERHPGNHIIRHAQLSACTHAYSVDIAPLHMRHAQGRRRRIRSRTHSGFERRSSSSSSSSASTSCSPQTAQLQLLRADVRVRVQTRVEQPLDLLHR